MHQPGLVLDSGEFVPADALNEHLRMPKLDGNRALKYNEIRYISGWPDDYVKEYASAWHKAESAKERCELTAAHVQAIKAAGLELPKNCWIVFDGPGAFDAPEAAQKALEDEIAAAGGLDAWKTQKPHQTQPTMTHEAIFHRQLKVVFNKSNQGIIMGMFRQALKEAAATDTTQPARELSDEEIDKIVAQWADAPASVRALGDGRTAEFWSVSGHRMRHLVRAAIAASREDA